MVFLLFVLLQKKHKSKGNTELRFSTPLLLSFHSYSSLKIFIYAVPYEELKRAWLGNPRTSLTAPKSSRFLTLSVFWCCSPRHPFCCFFCHIFCSPTHISTFTKLRPTLRDVTLFFKELPTTQSKKTLHSNRHHRFAMCQKNNNPKLFFIMWSYGNWSPISTLCKIAPQPTLADTLQPSQSQTKKGNCVFSFQLKLPFFVTLC